MLDDAALIMSANYRSLRSQGLSLLPQRFEDQTYAREALRDLFRDPKAMGFAAFSEGRLMAYLIGTPAVNSIRGRHVWIHPAGLGVAPPVSLELLRDLYARLGAIWVRDGYFDHFVLTLAQQDWLAPWFNAGFAYEQVHALLNLEELDSPALSMDPRLIIRQALPGDRSIVQSFSQIIPREHAAAPVWATALPEDLPEMYEGYGELLDEEGTTIWLAFLAEKAVGIQVYRTWPEGQVNLLIPTGAIRFVVGSTLEEARGMGISSTLLAASLKDALAKGFSYCETDWRITNLLSSRHWPKRGFVPVAYRLVRKVDPRIAWANGYSGLSEGDHYLTEKS